MFSFIWKEEKCDAENWNFSDLPSWSFFGAPAFFLISSVSAEITACYGNEHVTSKNEVQILSVILYTVPYIAYYLVYEKWEHS